MLRARVQVSTPVRYVERERKGSLEERMAMLLWARTRVVRRST